MAELWDLMLSPQAVNRAWRHLRRDAAPWSPQVDGQALRRHLPLHLLELVRDLDQGRYRPQALRQYPIAKPDGGRRVLSVYYLRDKLAQRLAVQVLTPLTERGFHHDSFGYRTGRGVADALARSRERLATGHAWVVDADIRRFFDEVPHQRLRARLRRTVPDRRLRGLIAQWLAMGPHPGSLLAPRRGLLQGAVISPLLCNLYLDPLDQAWARANIPFVRYADDFLLFASTREQAEAALAFTARRLKPLGLTLHPQKTCVRAAADGFRFLGEPLTLARHRRRIAGRTTPRTARAWTPHRP